MELAERLTRMLADRMDVSAAWLFGSRARSTGRLDSDADVAVLLAHEPAAGLEQYRFDLAGDLEQQLGVAIDLVVMNRAGADLVHRVLRDGILLLDRERSQRIAFEVKKRAEYLDMVPVWRTYRRQPPRP